MNLYLIIISVLGAALLAFIVISVMQWRKASSLAAEASELKASNASLSAEKAAIAAEKASLVADKSILLEQREALLGDKMQLREENASLLSRLDAQAEAQKFIREQGDKDLEKMKDVFKALAAENSESFNKKSSESIAQVLKPIQEKFSEFDKSVKDSQEKSVAQNASMKTLIEQVMQQSKTVGDEAKNLANALTGYSKVQGDFGEMLLTDVLRNAGLVEGVHFVTQSVMTDESGHEIKSADGATMIPDVMVFYPDDTTVIIDSKVSLKAYNQYMNAEAVEARRHYAKDHVESIRHNADLLKKKDYASYIPDGKSKVAYNIMFIPMEGAFRLMLEEDPMLWQLAKDNNVLIVSQMTLVIVLNMIQMSWRQHTQEKNINEVYKTASELMSQLSGWMESYMKIGEALEKAEKAYEDSRNKLTDGRQSVVQKIDKLEKLGLSPKRSNAKLKTGARMTMGRESIIPAELSKELDNTDTI